MKDFEYDIVSVEAMSDDVQHIPDWSNSTDPFSITITSYVTQHQ